MKKSYYKSLTVILFIFGVLLLSGCGKESFKESFTGEWSASQNSLKGNIYTGNIILNVKEDGSFLLSDDLLDVFMEGKLIVDDKTNIELKCDEAISFSPPLCWDSSESDTYTYEFITEDVVIIGFAGNKIAFYRNVEKTMPENLKDDAWLTNNGLDSQEITYSLEITDNEINFYIVDGEEIVRIMNGRNLQYDSDKKQLSFVPDTSVDFEPPYLWYADMGKSIQKIVLDVEQKDQYLVLEYNDVPLKFYNNLMYQMEKDSEILMLFDTSWVYEKDNFKYELFFPFGDTVFVTCVDGMGNEVFNGFAIIDETKNAMDLFLDVKNESPELWGGIKAEMKLIYAIKENILELTYNDKTIMFNIKE